MYNNLRKALREKRITNKQYADLLGVTEKSVDNKLSGRTEFTLSEVQKTRALFSEYTLDFLFAEFEKAI